MVSFCKWYYFQHLLKLHSQFRVPDLSHHKYLVLHPDGNIIPNHYSSLSLLPPFLISPKNALIGDVKVASLMFESTK